MFIKKTEQTTRTKGHHGLLRSLSISAFVALSLTMTAAHQSARAEEPPASIETVTSLQGPSTALENGVNGFTLPGFFCSDMDKTTRDRQLQELREINSKWINQIQEMVNWANSQRGRPVAAYYETEIRQVILLKAKLQRIARAIHVKRNALWNIPVKDCTNAPTDINMTTPDTPSEPVDPLAGIQFWQPRYYEVSAPGKPGRICKEIDKLDYIVAVASARADAGFNMNQADGVISDIEGHLRTAENPATRAALQALLTQAKANLKKRIEILDQFDVLYAEAQRLEVEDCFANDTEAAMTDPLDSSQFSDLGVAVHVPDLKAVTLIELPAFVCDEDERGRLMARATVQSSNALKNVYEWQKRRDAVAEALRQGEGNVSLLRQARYEADMEIGKREIVHQKTQEIFETARNLPIVDCSSESDDRTSMGPVSTPSTKDQDALLAAINDLLFVPSPYTSDGEIVLPYPTEPEDALIYDAEDAVHDRQRDVHRHEQWQNQKDRQKAADHKTRSQDKTASDPSQRADAGATTKSNTAAKNAKYGKAQTESYGQKGDTVPETHRAGPLGYPVKTKPSNNKGLSKPEITHEDIEYRTGGKGDSSPRDVYPPMKTTDPVLKAPSDLDTRHAEPKVDGQWVQVKPPVLVIPVEAAGAE